MATLTNADSRQSQNYSGNLKISPEVRDSWKFFRETRYNSGTLQKKSGHRRKFQTANLRIYAGNSKNFRE